MSDVHHKSGNRREDLRLITGRGRYASDWNFPRQLHAGFLRSDHAHAEILSINVAAALKRPGVVGVLTGADVESASRIQFANLAKFANRSGSTLLRTERPMLARGKVRFVGEAVALVVAESALAARDALDAIEVEYR